MGAGVPDDAVTTEKQKRVDEAIASKSPRDVLLEIMLFWQQRVDKLTLELKLLLSGKDDRAYQKHVAKKIVKALLVARDNSQRCAVAAAPYVHAKSKSARPEDPRASMDIRMTLPPLREGEDRSYREGYDEEGPTHLYRKPN